MKKTMFLLFIFCHLSYATELYWSKTGHRVIGAVAENYLSKKAKKNINKLLAGQSLAAVSNFADEIKADRTFKEFSAWHYVNYPADKKYTEVEPSPYGDVVMGIVKCIQILQNPKSSEPDKSFYLKMLIHLVGDLHQPMHVGRLEDKGGNDIQLQWFGRGSNLHKVWDANMIDDYGMSYTELANSLPRLSKSARKQIQQGSVYDWVEETQDIANQVYLSANVGEKLAYRYSYTHWGLVEKQLQRGGLRLAGILNELFG